MSFQKTEGQVNRTLHPFDGRDKALTPNWKKNAPPGDGFCGPFHPALKAALSDAGAEKVATRRLVEADEYDYSTEWSTHLRTRFRDSKSIFRPYSNAVRVEVFLIPRRQ